VNKRSNSKRADIVGFNHYIIMDLKHQRHSKYLNSFRTIFNICIEEIGGYLEGKCVRELRIKKVGVTISERLSD